MAGTQPFFPGYPSSPQLYTNIEEMAKSGIHAVFQARPVATTQTVLSQMDRRDRVVLILLDGKRTLQDVARLTHHSELEVARILVRFLKCGYVEFLGHDKEH
jgi:hypothetical protein